MDDCRFCRIAAGERDAHVLRSTDRTVAFLDANPAVEGHALVVPRDHVEDLVLADEETAAAVFAAARAVGAAMDAALDVDGFSLFHTAGSVVGTVDHAHLHLLPRTPDDDVHLSLPRDELDGRDAASLVERVRAELD